MFRFGSLPNGRKKESAMKKLSLSLLAVLFAVLFAAVPVRAQDEVTFAMLPQMSNVELAKCWKPLLAQLEKETGIKFKQVFANNFDEHVAMCKDGRIEVAYSNPFTFVQMIDPSVNKSLVHKAVGVADAKEGALFYGEFIVHADNADIRKFSDIKGKTGMVVGFDSAGGYIFQQGYALDNGFSLKTDCKITEAPGNKQEKVVNAVYFREVDFGCVRDGMVKKMKDKIDTTKIKVIASTPKYPGWAVSISSKVDKATAEKIAKAFAAIPADVMKAAALPGGVTGFKPASNSDFDSIKTLSKKLGE
ncbi:MAG: hypothetical protein A2204_07540 [Elusimicrobia bacterium RIFOXYA1_FULL_47_7]|nr:MAG: hypothetical protein A2278_06555 [Elusimicrobia bacterium RIFOXYA12_FULL_49_49]OGS07854.1 MAG: hypothetical protein A2204_07540 [Elusimicrobia bacterium RIFOXYA1_FULL_47_7]OGS16453.1 MAG: hypothetical protein A2251_06470 [Elusimicrobia bacterium RIFOXYA2_FULL_47_53]OGS26042.1 MAG: hypothetical protein A2339_01415 [Elusimicrobia bacterium RIFOXYB12_FULL_50_12]OGS29659.1 MAG: hypothetical protein A2323_03670 [Elusimicrobia bacterium RIFOXYB2_FULL_46_23]